MDDDLKNILHQAIRPTFSLILFLNSKLKLKEYILMNNKQGPTVQQRNSAQCHVAAWIEAKFGGRGRGRGQSHEIKRRCSLEEKL